MKRRHVYSLVLIIVFPALMTTVGLVSAAPAVIQPVLVNTVLTSQFSSPSPDPSGLAYNPNDGTLIMSDGEVDEMPSLYVERNIFVVTLTGELLDGFTTVTTPIHSNEPSGLAYNAGNGHLYISDDHALKVFDDDPGADGRFNTADDVILSFSTSGFGNSDPEGIGYDSWHNRMILTSGANEEVYIVDPGPNGVFEGNGDDLITNFDTTALGLRDPESVEFNSDNGNLFVLSALSNKIAEITPSGEVLRYIDISLLNGLFEAGMAYAPGSNNPAENHLYIVARGIDNGQDPNENDGKMYEISFPLLPSVPTPTGTLATNTLVPTSTPATVAPTLTSTSISAPLSTSTATIPSTGDLIFSDGFENGNVLGWSESVANGGNLSVQPNAALVGNLGLRVNIVNNTSMYLTDNTPNAETHYRARFYFDPNSIVMTSGDAHNIFYAYSSSLSTALIRSAFYYSSAQYRINMQVRDDANAWFTTISATLSDAPHVIEIEWQAASAASANDGKFNFWVDGALISSISGLDNDLRKLDLVRLGPSAGIDTGTRGIYYLDAFDSRHFSYIGPAVPSDATVTPISTNTAVSSLTSTTTRTAAPTLTFTSTAVASETFTPTKTLTSTSTVTRTSTATRTSTPTSTVTRTPTATRTVTRTAAPLSTSTATIPSTGDLIFSDGFENGNVLGWSESVANGGNLSVQPNAALVGNLGLRVNIVNNTSMYLTDNTPNAETHYRARFYFDPNSIVMTSGDAHNIFYAYSSSLSTALIRSAFYYSSAQYRINMQVRDDANAWFTTISATLSDAPHVIEIEWQAASAASANDGKFNFWVDGALISSISGLDNDLRKLDLVRFGPSAGIDTGTRGIYYLDAFESRHFSYIGPVIP